jgi:hypothetical protein
VTDLELELAALKSRAGIAEAQRQAAIARGDRQAAREAERELTRLHARFVELEDRAA